jgi:hypothetical protein
MKQKCLSRRIGPMRPLDAWSNWSMAETVPDRLTREIFSQTPINEQHEAIDFRRAPKQLARASNQRHEMSCPATRARGLFAWGRASWNDSLEFAHCPRDGPCSSFGESLVANQGYQGESVMGPIPDSIYLTRFRMRPCNESRSRPTNLSCKTNITDRPQPRRTPPALPDTKMDRKAGWIPTAIASIATHYFASACRNSPPSWCRRRFSRLYAAGGGSQDGRVSAPGSLGS